MIVSEPELGAILAAAARVTGLVVTAPVIGEQGVSARAKLPFVLVVAIAIGLARPPLALEQVPAAATLELAVGLLTGLTASFIVSKIGIAGQLAGLSLGLGFAQAYDVHAGESAGTLRTLCATIAGLAFLAAGGLQAVVKSAASPVDAIQLAGLGPVLVREGTAAFGHGLALAAPVVLAALAGNIGLAVMNRAAPAVNVFSVALGVVLAVGGLVMLASAAHLAQGAFDAARTSIAALGG